MSVNWPSEFPKTIISGYTLAPKSTTIRTEMEGGNARVRRRFSHAPTEVKARWIMEPRQFELFESWFVNRAMGGAEWVIMGLVSGSGYGNQTVRFLKQYQAKLLSDELWSVTAPLEVRDLKGMSEGDLTFLEVGDRMARYLGGESLASIRGGT